MTSQTYIIRAIVIILTAMLSYGAATGCKTSSLSAPPVAIPAPIAGKVTISQPDSTGVSLVVGDQGSVPSKALVLISVKDVEASTALLDAVTDMFIPTACAQGEFPCIVCDGERNACVYADELGAFSKEVYVGKEGGVKVVVAVIDALNACAASDYLVLLVPEAPPACGDGECNGDEACADCPEDCGACPSVCGDEECNGDESCTSCAVDCGACPPACGDGTCNGDETCESCAVDCGACPPACGDGTCDDDETCTNCPADCGVCPPPPPSCGDGACNGEETCDSCETDCGACPPSCGDGACNGGETCASCSDDCGACPGEPLCPDHDGSIIALEKSGDMTVALMEGDVEHWSGVEINGWVFRFADLCDVGSVDVVQRPEDTKIMISFGEVEAVLSLTVWITEDGIALSWDELIVIDGLQTMHDIPGNHSHMFMPIAKDGGLEVGRYGIEDMKVNKSFMAALPEGHALSKVLDIAMMGISKDQGNLVATLVETSDAVGDMRRVVILTETSTFTDKINKSFILDDVVADVDFALVGGGVHLVAAAGALELIPVMRDGEVFTLGDNLAKNVAYDLALDDAVAIDAPDGMTVKAFAVDVVANGPSVIYSLVSGAAGGDKLWIASGFDSDEPVISVIEDVEGFDSLKLIAIDDGNMLIGGEGEFVDASALLLTGAAVE